MMAQNQVYNNTNYYNNNNNSNNNNNGYNINHNYTSSTSSLSSSQLPAIATAATLTTSSATATTTTTTTTAHQTLHPARPTLDLHSHSSGNLANPSSNGHQRPQFKNYSSLKLPKSSQHKHARRPSPENFKVNDARFFDLNSKQEPKTTFKFKSGEKFMIYSYFRPIKIIGEGSYASVCSAVDERTKKKVAIKKNRNAFVNIGDAKRILRELKLMKHFRGHPNLMSVNDVIAPDLGTQQTFNDVYLIMPKMHMPLNKLILKSSIGKIKLYESDVKSIIYQMMRGLQYMHSAGVIHRDLKPENILINSYYHHCNEQGCKIQNKSLWQVRITDFGLARGILDCNGNNDASNGCFNDNGQRIQNELTEYVVTRYYRAPEVMCCSRLYDSQIDVWSLGCIFGEIFYKKALFRGINHLHQLQVIFYFCGTPTNDDLNEWVKMNDAKEWIKQLDKIKKKDFRKIFSFYNYCNSQQQDTENKNDQNNNNLFDGQQQQKSSPSPPQIPFNDDKCGIMSELAADFLNKLLICNPNKRWNITKALNHEWLKEVNNEKDVFFAPKFNTSFESEPILRTNFGVRHMMYEELQCIHKLCQPHHIQQQ